MEIKNYKTGDRYYLKEISDTFYLGNREAQVIYLRILGKKNKQISEIMKLSKRTIEAYIVNIKNKSPFHKSKELINAIKKTDFMKAINFKFNN